MSRYQVFELSILLELWLPKGALNQLVHTRMRPLPPLPSHSAIVGVTSHPSLTGLRTLQTQQEGAMRLLEEDPYRKSGLFGTVSLYRYPYNMGGGFNWQLSNFPYVALCMDKKGKAKVRKDKQEAHLEYYEKTR